MRTTQPTSGSSARRGRASSRASSIGRDMALSRSGRLRVSTATPSFTVSSKSVVIGAPPSGAAAIVPLRRGAQAADRRGARGARPRALARSSRSPPRPRRSGPSCPTPSRSAGSPGAITCTCRRRSARPPPRSSSSSTGAAAPVRAPSGSPASRPWPTGRRSWWRSRKASRRTGTTAASSRLARAPRPRRRRGLRRRAARHDRPRARGGPPAGVRHRHLQRRIFSHYLAAHLSARIAAIAPVVGGIADPPEAWLRPEQPVSVLILQGTRDPLVPYHGGAVAFGRGKIIDTEEAARRWARSTAGASRCRRRCPPTARTAAAGSGPSTRAGATAARWCWCASTAAGTPGPGGAQYLPERLIGRVCRDFDATALIWDFFRAHPKPGGP